MHKDFLGKDLNIGDKIIFKSSEYKSNPLKLGEVVGFTPKMIRCLQKGRNLTSTYNDYTGNPGIIYNTENRYSEHVYKIL